MPSWIRNGEIWKGKKHIILFNEIVYIQLLVNINVKWLLSSSLIVLKHNGSLDIILEGIGLLVSMLKEMPSYSN